MNEDRIGALELGVLEVRIWGARCSQLAAHHTSPPLVNYLKVVHGRALEGDCVSSGEVGCRNSGLTIKACRLVVGTFFGVGSGMWE